MAVSLEAVASRLEAIASSLEASLLGALSLSLSLSLFMGPGQFAPGIFGQPACMAEWQPLQTCKQYNRAEGQSKKRATSNKCLTSSNKCLTCGNEDRTQRQRLTSIGEVTVQIKGIWLTGDLRVT